MTLEWNPESQPYRLPNRHQPHRVQSRENFASIPIQLPSPPIDSGCSLEG